MFDKDFKHDASKLIFARWQAQLAPFNFEIQKHLYCEMLRSRLLT